MTDFGEEFSVRWCISEIIVTVVACAAVFGAIYKPTILSWLPTILSWLIASISIIWWITFTFSGPLASRIINAIKKFNR